MTSNNLKCENNLKILYFNAQSLLNKLKSLHSLLLSQNFDIICVTETWLKDTILDSVLIHNTPYSIVRNDRGTKQRGGGCCIIISNRIQFKIVSNISIHHVNLVCIDIFSVFSFKTTRLINLYCPPNFKNFDLYSEFTDFLSEQSTTDSHLIIVGDFNAPNICWGPQTNNLSHNYPATSVERELINFATCHNLTQLVYFPTRKQKTLDLLFTNEIAKVTFLSHLPPFGTFNISDHDSFSFVIDNNSSSTPPAHTPTPNALPVVYQFHTADYTLINNHIRHINWHSVFALCPTTNADNCYDPRVHINEMYAAFEKIICEIITQFVPTREIGRINFPNHINSLYKYRTQLWRQHKFDRNKLKKCSVKLNKEINKYLKNKEKRSLSNIKSKYRYAGAFLKSKSKQIPAIVYKNKTLFTDSDKSIAFSNTFEGIFNHNKFSASDINLNETDKTLDFIPIHNFEVYKYLKSLRPIINSTADHIPDIFLKNCKDSICFPLTYLFQFMIMSKTIPDVWKKSIIVPIPKILSSSNPIDYRPISLLCCTSKIFEKILFSYLTNFFETNNIIPKNQHGFQRKKSVVTSLIETYEDLSIAHEKSLVTDVIYFDLAKAFDSVPINRLIAKLSSFGIRGPLLQLINYYLSNRTFVVRTGNSYSNEKQIPSGVPQGSIGGPLLFVAYISDLPKHCKVEGVEVKLFADDLKAYSSSKSPDNIYPQLQNFIDKLVDYCAINGLSINPKKCEVLHLGNSNKCSSYSLLGNKIKSIDKHESVRDLGLYFTTDLKFEKHIEIITTKARRISFGILKSIKYSNATVLINLYKIYVRPILEFATCVFNPYLLKHIHKIEKIQKDFLKIIYKRLNSQIFQNNPIAPLPPYKQLLFMFNIESLELRRLKQDLIMFHKYLHGYAKINCYNSFKIYETKTRGDKYKIVPNLCTTIVRHNAFFVLEFHVYMLNFLVKLDIVT